MPRVTVLMPLFNGVSFIEESLHSIQAQTYQDWEFIIVNDFGSNDGCADIVREYAEKDSRIKLVQTEKRLGLAASLNLGLDMAQGEYVARVDVDDPSDPSRLEKQVAFMDAHPELSLCSCWQISKTPNYSKVQKVAFKPEELKAAMLFGCEISHCGVMLRLADFNSHGWRYDPEFLGEDYELWTRALAEGAVMANIPEPLVTHRWGYENISLGEDKGDFLKAEVRRLSKRSLNQIGVDTEKYDPLLFSGWRDMPKQFKEEENRDIVLKNGLKLLFEIYEKNLESHYINEAALKKILLQRWDWIRTSCGLKFEANFPKLVVPAENSPRVSVVMPTFNAAGTISESIDSVLHQTFTNWELLVVNDFDSDDGTAEIVKAYAWVDPRIRLIQAETNLGLAESLNLGFREAKGEYIARLDADDTSMPERFEKQISFMDSHRDIGLCGTWQRNHGKKSDWIHRPEPDPDKLRCKLLFWCDLCHSTLMLRKDLFLKNNLFYDRFAKAEDYELWTRAAEFMKIANIPEVLGTYNETTGITGDKVLFLTEESGQISGNFIKRVLGLELSRYEEFLLNAWTSPISSDIDEREEQLKTLQKILTKIYEKNQKAGFFDSNGLLEVLAAKWHWAKDNIDWETADYSYVRSIEDVFAEQTLEAQEVSKHGLLKKILLPVISPFRKVIKVLMRDTLNEISSIIEEWTWDRYQRTNKDIERWTWERYQRSKRDMEACKQELLNDNFVQYVPGEKIRVLFMFQAASFWPSWESFYNSCLNDSRIELIFAFLDEKYGDTTQMKTAKSFLDKQNIPYVIYTDQLLDNFRPHVLILQTPYDEYHRMPHVRSGELLLRGMRIVYIPYGIEIADTDAAHNDHFNRAVKNCWRVYTFSDRMRMDYCRYTNNGRAVRALGHPRFDGLYHKEKFHLPEEVIEHRQGRKIVLWHVHFPKLIPVDDTKKIVTPYLEEYIAFTEYVKLHSELFFIFQAHPKFLDCKGLLRTQAVEILAKLKEADNVYIDTSDNYRECLVNSDYIITDRSAVMIEAGALDVPVLYMSNADYQEPMTEAVRPLVESYEQGTACSDMTAFVERCKKGLDLNKEKREAAFKKCIPYFDGKCGERIKEDIIASLQYESHSALEYQFADQTSHLEARIANLEEKLDILLNKISESDRQP